MLPFAVQFLHSFEHHHQVCNSAGLHIDSHKQECEVFHFKINQNTIFFPLEFEILKQHKPLHKIQLFEAICNQIQLQNKLSRAPPTLLLLHKQTTV